jgi:hypothetical protein
MTTWSRIAAWATTFFLGALVAGSGAIARGGFLLRIGRSGRA